jgi:hypothetical protein
MFISAERRFAWLMGKDVICTFVPHSTSKQVDTQIIVQRRSILQRAGRDMSV